ncbi:MAG TPA: AMP-binding protein, partial [Terriglobales bacterium]|nr:AMP-binding protein [Terriglobales bacterium]
FRRLVIGQAAYFQEQGLCAGDTVILIMPQGIALMASFMAAMHLGAVPAILAYPTFKVEPAKYRFGLAGVSANLKARLIVLDEAFPDELTAHVSIGERTQLLRYSESAADSFQSVEGRSIDPAQAAFIQHSAGTTGLQKGVALSHAAVLNHLNLLGPALDLRENDRIYSWLPLYHDMGLVACFMLPMVFRLPVIMQAPTDWVLQPRTMLELISQHQCTLAWMPNFTFQFLARRVKAQNLADVDLSRLRALINCSEPVRASSMDEFLASYAQLGVRPEMLQTSYAMAETVFAVTQSSLDGGSCPARIWIDNERLRRQNLAVPVDEDAPAAACYVSSGRCLPGTEVRIVSALGEDLGEGEVGEILIRSESMLNGYYNRPDLTQKALRSGWYWSGDLGFTLEEELYVVGRKKDLIIVAGENIYPQDVEEIVSSHPAVYDGRVVALGLYNPDQGTEEIIVVAELRQQADLENSLPIERELKNAIAGELGVAAKAVYLKPPKWIVKSTAGKPARSTTREKLLAEHAELRRGPIEVDRPHE